MSGGHTRRDALVVGGDGLVGGELALALRRTGHSVRVTSRRPRSDALPLDLVNPDLDLLDAERFACAFICAAMTSMRACEEAPDEARRINVEGTLAVMRRLAAAGTYLVFLSSSQVFDGDTPLPDEQAPRQPKNLYGRQKLEVEEAIAGERLPASILRVTKVLASRPVGMFRAWYDSLQAGRQAFAAANMTIAPVAIEDVVAAAIRLGAGRHAGAWHLSSADELPYYDAALRMAQICGLAPALVRREEVTEAHVPAIYRHRHAAIDSRKLAAALDFPIRTSAAVLTQQFSAYDRPSQDR